MKEKPSKKDLVDLIEAGNENKEKIIECIKLNPSLVTEIYENDQTILMLIAAKLDSDFLTWFLTNYSYFLDFKKSDNHGHTAIFYAVLNQKSDNLKILLASNEMNINHRDKRGDTAILHAARLGSRECVKALLQYNANLNIKNEKSESVWLLASEHEQIIEELIGIPNDISLINDLTTLKKDLIATDKNFISEYAKFIYNYKELWQMFHDWHKNEEKTDEQILKIKTLFLSADENISNILTVFDNPEQITSDHKAWFIRNRIIIDEWLTFLTEVSSFFPLDKNNLENTNKRINQIEKKLNPAQENLDIQLTEIDRLIKLGFKIHDEKDSNRKTMIKKTTINYFLSLMREIISFDAYDWCLKKSSSILLYKECITFLYKDEQAKHQINELWLELCFLLKKEFEAEQAQYFLINQAIKDYIQYEKTSTIRKFILTLRDTLKDLLPIIRRIGKTAFNAVKNVASVFNLDTYRNLSLIKKHWSDVKKVLRTYWRDNKLAVIGYTAAGTVFVVGGAVVSILTGGIAGAGLGAAVTALTVSASLGAASNVAKEAQDLSLIEIQQKELVSQAKKDIEKQIVEADKQEKARESYEKESLSDKKIQSKESNNNNNNTAENIKKIMLENRATSTQLSDVAKNQEISLDDVNKMLDNVTYQHKEMLQEIEERQKKQIKRQELFNTYLRSYEDIQNEMSDKKKKLVSSYSDNNNSSRLHYFVGFEQSVLKANDEIKTVNNNTTSNELTTSEFEIDNNLNKTIVTEQQILFGAIVKKLFVHFDENNILKLIEEHRIKANDQDEGGNTFLHWLILNQNADTITQYLKSKTDINFLLTNNFSETSLMLAVKMGNLEIVQSICGKIAENKHASNIFNALAERRDSSGNTIMHIAAQRGYLDILQFLTAPPYYMSPETTDKNGFHPIHAAMSNNQIDCVKYLSQYYPNPNIQINQYSFLHYVVIKNIPSLVNFWIEKEVDQTLKTDMGETALHLAVSRQYRECICQFQHSPILNLKTNSGHTALMLAVFNKDKPTVELLLSFLADPGFDLEDKDKNTAIAIAMKLGQQDIASSISTAKSLRSPKETLLRTKKEQPEGLEKCSPVADIEKEFNLACLNKNTSEAYKKVKAIVVNHNFNVINYRYSGNRTALFLAVDAENSELLKYFLTHKININHRDESGKTIINYILSKKSLNCLKVILNLGKNHYLDYLFTDSEDRNIFHMAAELDSDFLEIMMNRIPTDVIDKLINGFDKNGRAPVQVAVHAKNFKAFAILLQAKADITLVDKQRRNCLHALFQEPSTNENMQIEVIKLITKFFEHQESENSINDFLNTEDSNGDTPLHFAVQQNKNLISYFCKFPLDVNKRNLQGSTPLHTLVNLVITGKQNLNVLIEFIKINQNINYSLINNDGSTALDIAKKLANIKEYKINSENVIAELEHGIEIQRLNNALNDINIGLSKKIKKEHKGAIILNLQDSLKISIKEILVKLKKSTFINRNTDYILNNFIVILINKINLYFKSNSVKDKNQIPRILKRILHDSEVTLFEEMKPISEEIINKNIERLRYFKRNLKTNLKMYYGVCDALIKGNVEVANDLAEKMQTFTYLTDFILREVIKPLINDEKVKSALTFSTLILNMAIQAYSAYKEKREIQKAQIFYNTFKISSKGEINHQLISDIAKNITYRYQDQIAQLTDDGSFILAQICALRIINFIQNEKMLHDPRISNKEHKNLLPIIDRCLIALLIDDTGEKLSIARVNESSQYLPLSITWYAGELLSKTGIKDAITDRKYTLAETMLKIPGISTNVSKQDIYGFMRTNDAELALITAEKYQSKDASTKRDLFAALDKMLTFCVTALVEEENLNNNNSKSNIVKFHFIVNNKSSKHTENYSKGSTPEFTHTFNKT